MRWPRVFTGRRRRSAGTRSVAALFPTKKSRGCSISTELLILSAAKDTKPALMDPKEMAEASMKTIGTGHPGVFMLFPNSKPGAAQLVSKENNHWVLNTKEEITVAGKKAGSIGIGLVVVGNAN